MDGPACCATPELTEACHDLTSVRFQCLQVTPYPATATRADFGWHSLLYRRFNSVMHVGVTASRFLAFVYLTCP